MLSSCADDEKKDDKSFSFGFFEKTEDLTADSIVINEILEPSAVNNFINDDYAVLISNKSNKIMYRYRLPEWTFVDTTFSRGNGPDEFLNAAIVVCNPPDENMRFFDVYKRKLCFAHVGEKIDMVSTMLSSKGYESAFFISDGKMINDRFIVSDANC